MKTVEVIQEILNERVRQVHDEGFSLENDDKYTHYQLSRAACCYLLAISRYHLGTIWPRDWDFKWFKFDHKNIRRALVKAAALIVAEIERLDRMEKAK